MKIVISFLCFVLIGFSANAENFKSKPPIKWGKVSKTELQLNSVDYESNASAVVLCDYGTIEITNRTIYTRHVRIKILKPEGLIYSTVEIPYQHKNKYDDVRLLKAQLFHVHSNGKLTAENISPRTIKDIQVDDYHAVKRISFPNLKPGSIFEYKYEIASMDFVKLDDWEFQRDIPTLWSELRIDVPEPFIYLLTYQKGPELTRDEKVAFALSLEKLKHTKWKRAKREMFMHNDILFEAENKNYVVHVINEKRKKIIHRSLPALSDRKHEQVAINRAPRLRFHLFRSEGIMPPIFKPLMLTVQEDFEDMSRSEIRHKMQPAGYVHYRLESWQEMNQRYLNSDRFGMVLMKHVNFMPVFNKALDNDMSTEEKVAALTDYVQRHVLWNGIYETYVRRDLNSVIKSGRGSSSEVNFLLIYLLKKAGIEASPVLAKTVDKGRVEDVYPVRDQFNHVLVLATIENEHVILDLTITDKDRALPVNPRGWIVRKNGYGWINIIKPNIKFPENDIRYSAYAF